MYIFYVIAYVFIFSAFFISFIFLGPGGGGLTGHSETPPVTLPNDPDG